MENIINLNSINRVESEETNSDEREEIRRVILDKKMYPQILKDFDLSIYNQNYYEKTSRVFLMLKYILLIASPILSFSTGVFPEHILIFNFVSASLSSLGLGFDRLHNYAKTNAQIYNAKTNEILKTFNINLSKMSFKYYEDDKK